MNKITQLKDYSSSNVNTADSTDNVSEESHNNEELQGATTIDMSDPLSDYNIRAARNLLKKISETAEIMQNIWMDTRCQYCISNEHMYKLYQFCAAHTKKDKHPEDDNQDDLFTAVYKLSPDNIKDIFGDNHPFTKTATAAGMTDIIKNAFEDYMNFIRFSNELRETDVAYRRLLELREDNEMLKLQEIANNEQDPNKKALLQKSLDHYHSIKYLDYMANPIPEQDKLRLIHAFGDEKKIEYYINRTKDKLDQFNITPRFILEVSNLEKIHLPERYHMLSNMTLLYFMTKIMHVDAAGATSSNQKMKEEFAEIMTMIHALDAVVRHTNSPENVATIKNNIMAFLEQLIEPVYEKYYPDKVIPELPKEDKQ